MQTLSKAELKMKLNGWVKELEEQANAFLERRVELRLKAHEYKTHIMKAFMIVTVRALSPEELGLTDEEVEELNEQYDFEKMRGLRSYSRLNPLAILRIYYRKLKKLEKDFCKEREPLRRLFKELKEIDQATKKYPELQSTITFYREITKEALDEKFDDSAIDYWMYVESLLGNGYKMKRDDFLQVITVDKSLRYWDGGKIEPYQNRVADIPEEIDLDTFKKLVFIERIEAEGDCYLHKIFMKHFFTVKEQYEKQTGEEAFDTFKVLEDIAGKPLQTFTTKLDEYGDVVSMTPNKPKLRLVEKGSNTKLEEENGSYE